MIESALSLFQQMPVGLKFLVLLPLILLFFFVFGLFLTLHFTVSGENANVGSKSQIRTLLNIGKLGMMGTGALGIFIVPTFFFVYILNYSWDDAVTFGLIAGLILIPFVYFFLSPIVDR